MCVDKFSVSWLVNPTAAEQLVRGCAPVAGKWRLRDAAPADRQFPGLPDPATGPQRKPDRQGRGVPRAAGLLRIPGG
jgi:hypothetical protein